MAATTGPDPAGTRRTRSGLERTGLAGALVVGAVFAFFAIGLPLIANAVPPPGDALTPGRALVLPGGRAQFTPASGWTRSTDDGTSDLVVLVNGSISFRIGAFRSTASAQTALTALQQTVGKKFPTATFGTTISTQTSSGLVGAFRTFTATQVDGFVAGYSGEGTVVLVTAIGTTGAVSSQSDSIVSMLRSVALR